MMARERPRELVSQVPVPGCDGATLARLPHRGPTEALAGHVGSVMGGLGTDEQPERPGPGPIGASFLLNEWERLADARRLAHSFFDEIQVLHGLVVSARVVEVVELIVSELVTNARKYASGPIRLTLEVADGRVEVSVWDSNPTPPAILPPDPFRSGQHGLNIVIASTVSLKVYPELAGKRITAVALVADAHPIHGLWRSRPPPRHALPAELRRCRHMPLPASAFDNGGYVPHEYSSTSERAVRGRWPPGS